MYTRLLTPVLKKFAKFYPIVGLTGPRQSGKTTLAKIAFDHLPYISLENLDIRLRAEEDPRGFLKKYKHGAIFDEVQNTPDLLSYLQEIVDSSSQKGRYILTGSQNFSLNHQISQSLSGRIGMTTLLPLSLVELNHKTNTTNNVNNTIFQGGYPALHTLGMHALDFYPSYIQTYIERDIRQLKNIENMGRFQSFLKLCAGRVGQIINYSSLAQDCGISHTTARQWLTILEASYIIFTLQPFYQNFNKRLIKMPKLYFYDTGLICSLLGLENYQQIETHYLKGALFENLIILEILKHRFNHGLPSNLYFWRDQTGHEIDLIGDWGGNIHAFEIKSNHTFYPEQLKNLNYIKKLDKKIKTYLIYSGNETGHYAQTEFISLWEIKNRIKNF